MKMMTERMWEKNGKRKRTERGRGEEGFKSVGTKLMDDKKK